MVVDPQTWLACHDPLKVVPLRDPVVEAAGHEPRSPYVESFWLPVVGPSAVVTARRLAAWLEESPQGVSVSLAVLAHQLGLGTGTGRNAPLVKTLARLTIFGLAVVRDDVYAMRLAFPSLTRRHLRRLPSQLMQAHGPLTDGCPIRPDVSVAMVDAAGH
jgi:hypothetical protein